MALNTTLATVGSLTQNPTTAQTAINNNFVAVNAALAEGLALNGQSPNQMQASLDMNSNQIINLPAPSTANSPIRMGDLTGGGTVVIPVVQAGTNISLTGVNPVTVATVTNPVFTSMTLAGNNITTNTGSGANVLATNPSMSSIAFSPTTSGLVGTTVSDNASAGIVGEYIESVITSGAPVNITTSGTPQTITSIVLSSGDWDVSASLGLNAAGVLSFSFVSLSQTNNTLDSSHGRISGSSFANTGSAPNWYGPVGPVRFNVTGNTTIFMVADVGFTSTCSGFGLLRARRIR